MIKKIYSFKTDFKDLLKINKLITENYAFTIKSINIESDRLQLGSCLILLKSIYNCYTSIEKLLEYNYIESMGSVASSLWEKSVTIQFLVINIEEKIFRYSQHQSFRQTPWSIKKMVTEIVNNEVTVVERKKFNVDLMYFQYSYLCAIKHGNPYTVSKLNSYSKNENFFYPEPRKDPEDYNILKYIYMLTSSSMIDSLIAFNKKFCNSNSLKEIINIASIFIIEFRKMNIRPTPIIIMSTKDFNEDFIIEMKNKMTL